MQSNNNLLPRPNLTKIPGELPKSKPDRYIDDLSKLTKVQLLEVKEREEKLLSNKLRLSKLPDKGQRIKDFYEKVLKELKHRDDVEQAALLFSDLNIASEGQKKLNHLEWNGKYEHNEEIEEEIIIDSDDEHEDPLKVIASSISKKVVKIVKEKSLITEEDIKEIESFKEEEKNKNENNKVMENNNYNLSSEKLRLNNLTSAQSNSTKSLNLDPHALYLIEKKGIDGLPEQEKFKPYKTTKSNVHDPEKEKLRKPKGENWEVTAATPPFIQHSGVQLLPLQESVEIQMQYLERMKELKQKQAEEMLKGREERKSELRTIISDEKLLKLSKFFRSYRTELEEDESDDDILSDNEYLFGSHKEKQLINSDEEVHDDEDERGGVTYTVYK